jgi:hypothetical protein
LQNRGNKTGPEVGMTDSIGILQDWALPDREKLFSYLKVNSFCSEQHKLFYVATPKVACTLLKWWVADLEGYAQALREIKSSAETDPDLVIHDSFHKVAPEVAGLSKEALLEPLTSEAYFRFAVVRNPYKRIFSAWQSKLLLREPLQIAPYVGCEFFNRSINTPADIATAFEGFLEYLAAYEAPNFRDYHWSLQASLLRPDLINYTKLVKIENAKELSVALAEWMGPKFVDPFAIRGVNESLIPYLPEFITKRSLELIRKLYADDFEVFKYETRLPEGKEIFTEAQFELAVRAILMIRGRHQRFAEARGYLNQIISDLRQELSECGPVSKPVFSRAQVARIEAAVQPDKMLRELVLSLARAGHHAAVANIHAKLAKLNNEGVNAFPIYPAGEVDLKYKIDLYQDGYFRGWILDKNRPLIKMAIEIIQNQRVIAKGIADQFRRDLAEAEIGDGCCAFNLKVDVGPTPDGGAIVLRVIELDKVFEVQPASIPGVVISLRAVP